MKKILFLLVALLFAATVRAEDPIALLIMVGQMKVPPGNLLPVVFMADPCPTCLPVQVYDADGNIVSDFGGGGGGGLTSVAVDAPLTGLGTSGSHISMPAATNSVNGYLTSADHTTFAAKQSALTFSQSLSNSGGTVTLSGDTASPGNTKLYGTNGSGVKGWYDQPAGGGGGATNFTGLADVPGNYTGASDRFVKVKTDETGLTFVAPPAGAGDVTGPSSSVDSELALFSSTSGKVVKRATGTGIPHLTSGVLSSTSTIATADIANNAVDFTKTQQVATQTVLGRSTAATGNVEALSVGAGLLVSGGTISNSGVTSLTGTASRVTVSASTGGVTLSLPTTINVDTTGNATTATSLAANGTNCPAGQSARGVDAAGNAEGCFTPSGAGNVVGPGSAVDANAVVFDGASGTLVKDAGFAPASNAAHYVTTQAESGLSAESNLGGLASGILVCNISAGVCTPLSRLITAGSAKITIANGDGVSGNIIVNLGSVASGDLTDTANIVLLNANQTFTGTNTFGDGLLRPTNPRITTGIKDANGNPMFTFVATSSAINGFEFTNSATGNGVQIRPGGAAPDANVDLILSGLGTTGRVCLGGPCGTNSPISGTGLFATNAQTATYQVLAADFAVCKTITVASGTFTITLVASGSQPATGQCIKVINYGSGVVTIARSGQNINGGTSSLTLPASSATAPTEAFVVSDGTNYFANLSISAGITALSSLATVGTVTSGTLSTGAVIGGVTMTLGSDATGDVYYRNSSGVLTRLAVGGANTVLHGGASIPAYSAVTGSDMTANTVTSTQMAVVNTRRVCDIAVGDTSGSVITNAQLGPQKRICYIPAAATIVEMDVSADAGTPNVIVAKNSAGSVSNIVSSALATASSGGIACSKTTSVTGIDGATTCTNTLQNTSLAAGDYLELVSGTAGGTAKLMTIHVIYTVN